MWFREDLEMHKRMKALGDLIESHSPDVMCFQVFSNLFIKLIRDFINSHPCCLFCLDTYAYVILQEVTPSFYGIFQKSSWWKRYCCSIPDETAFPGAYFCMQVI